MFMKVREKRETERYRNVLLLKNVHHTSFTKNTLRVESPLLCL
jgi:hypothetical protein